MRLKRFVKKPTISKKRIYRYNQPLVKASPAIIIGLFFLAFIASAIPVNQKDNILFAANGNIYPDGDTTAQFANSTGANHWGEIDEVTLNTGGAADYINTGTGGSNASAEVEEYTMTSVAGPTAPVTSVQVHIYAYAQGGCQSTCDQLNVQISIDGGAFTTANTVTLTGTSQELAVTAFTGSWTGDDDVSVRITRVVQGSGNPNNQDDDVRIDRVRADVTYTPVANLDQTHFRWRDDSAALNTSSGWLGPYTSGQPIIVNHTWSKKGTYYLKAKAKDDKGAESYDWRTLEVSIPRTCNLLILRLLERFLNKFPILRHLLGL